MHFSSLREIFSLVGKTFSRFPLSVFSAFAATVLSIFTIEIDSGTLRELLIPYVLTFFFAFPLFLSFELFQENWKLKSWKRFALWALGAAIVLGAHFWSFRYLSDWTTFDAVRGITMNLMSWLLVLILPAVKRFSTDGYWNYLFLIFVRILQAAVYFGVLFIGCALLLASIDYLFDVRIDENLYLDIFWFISGVFASLFFLGGFPQDYKVLNEKNLYPVWFKVLVMYILLPLVATYLLVLYVYTGSIVIKWEWPEGGVAWWVIFYSFVSVLTFGFLYPLRNVKSAVVNFYDKWIFALLIPLVFVLFAALQIRIDEYGVTPARYYGFVYMLWLLFISCYFLFDKKKDLKVVTFSLLIVSLLSIVGPWNSLNVSAKSQVNRLEELLVKNEMLVDGEIKKIVEEDMPSLSTDEKRDFQSIDSIVSFLVRNREIDRLNDWFGQDLNSLKQIQEWGVDYYEWEVDVLALMGLNNRYYYVYPEENFAYNYVNLYNENFSYKSSELDSKPMSEVAWPLNVSGYDFVYVGNSNTYYDYNDEKMVMNYPGGDIGNIFDNLNWDFDIASNNLEVFDRGDAGRKIFEFNTTELVEALPLNTAGNYVSQVADLTRFDRSFENEKYEIDFGIVMISGNVKTEKKRQEKFLDSFRFILLIKNK